MSACLRSYSRAGFALVGACLRGQELAAEGDKLGGRIPLREVLAAVQQMHIELWVSLLEERGPLSGGAAILFAVDHQQRHGKLVQPLPDGDALFAAASRQLAPLLKSLKVFSYAHAVTLL